jgi:hypothetical protein
MIARGYVIRFKEDTPIGEYYTMDDFVQIFQSVEEAQWVRELLKHKSEIINIEEVSRDGRPIRS